MPLKLNVGVSRKLGLPNYCSAGASCNIEVELDSNLLQNDPEGFQAHIRRAFSAAQQAVTDELVRLKSEPTRRVPGAVPASGHALGSTALADGVGAHSNGVHARTNGVASPVNGHACSTEVVSVPDSAPQSGSASAATSSQVRAIYAIAFKKRIDMEGLLREEFGAVRPENLTTEQARDVIARLQNDRLQ